MTPMMHLTLLSHILHHRSNLETPQIFASTQLTPQELNQYEVVVKLMTYATVIFVPIKKPNAAFLYFSANSNKIKRFVSSVYPEFFFELVLYPGEETKGPTSQGVM